MIELIKKKVLVAQKKLFLRQYKIVCKQLKMKKYYPSLPSSPSAANYYYVLTAKNNINAWYRDTLDYRFVTEILSGRGLDTIQVLKILSIIDKYNIREVHPI